MGNNPSAGGASGSVETKTDWDAPPSVMISYAKTGKLRLMVVTVLASRVVCASVYLSATSIVFVMLTDWRLLTRDRFGRQGLRSQSTRCAVGRCWQYLGGMGGTSRADQHDLYIYLSDCLNLHPLSHPFASRDHQDIPLNADWLSAVHKGIEQSDVFIFVLSPASVKSEVRDDLI